MNIKPQLIRNLVVCLVGLELTAFDSAASSRGARSDTLT